MISLLWSGRLLARSALFLVFLLVAACSARTAEESTEQVGKISQATMPSFSATLTSAKTFKRPNGNWVDGVNATVFAAGSVNASYAASPFTVSVTGAYDLGVVGGTLPTNADCPNGNDTILFLYRGVFDRLAPLTNLLVANDNVALGPNCKSKINTWSLTAGQVYTLVVTTYYGGEFGTVDYVVSGPGLATGSTTSSLDVTGLSASPTACAQSTLTLTARDSGNAVSTGYVGTVQFTSSDAQATLPSSYTFVAGDNGTKSFDVTLRTAGSQTVTVTDTGYGFNGVQTATVLADAPATATATAGTPQSALTTTVFAAPLTVHVVDGCGTGNAIAGTTVGFAVPLSGASAGLASSAVTNGGGDASVIATAGTVGGTYSVTASVASLPDVMFSLTNVSAAPATIVATTGTGQHATVGAAFPIALTVLVTDSQGNGVVDAEVTFTAPGAGAGATAVLGLPSAMTDATGHATTTAIASATAGAYVVTATTGALTAVMFGLVNDAGAAASLTLVSGSGQTQVVNAAYPAPVVVLVRDANDNAVPDATVTFAAPLTGASAALSNGGSSTTDAGGHASVTLTANGLAGTFAVGVSTAGVSSAGSFSLTNTASAPATLTLVSGSAQATTVGHAFAAPLVVEVRDSSGNAVPSAVVAFAVDAAAASGSLSASPVATTALGRASTSVVANTVSGSFHVTATVAGAPAVTFSLTNNPDATAVVSVVPSSTPQAAQVRTGFAMPLAVKVVDVFGNVVPQIAVHFTTPAPGGAPTASLDAATATTDANGIATVHATASTVAGVYTAHASVVGTATSADFLLTNLAGAASVIAASAGDNQSAVVHTAFPAAIGVVLHDADGNAVPNAQVTFHVPGSGASAILGASSAITDATGHASVLATAGDVTGYYAVTATVQDGASPATLSLRNTQGAAFRVTAGPDATPQSTQAAAPYARALGVTVQDAYGNAVHGATVAYAITPNGASGTLSADSAITASTGSASVSIEANNVAGSFTVTASVVGATTSARFDLTNLAAAASTLTVFGGSAQIATVATRFASPLVVLVHDAYGNAVPGAFVRFAPPTSGARAAVSLTVATDASGKAQTFADSGTVAGHYEIRATVDGAAAPGRFSLTNVPGAPASVVAELGATPQIAQVLHAFEVPLGVTVTDSFGNRVRNAAVLFTQQASAASATLSAMQTSTGVDGIARVLAVAGAQAGPYAVTAQVADLSHGAHFALENTAGPPSRITLLRGGGMHAVATTAFRDPLVLQISDATGNGVAGALLTVTLPPTGASATIVSSDLVTDASGQVRVTLRANDVPGSFAAVVAAQSVAAPVAVPLAVDAITTRIAASTTLSDLTVDVRVPITITVTSDSGIPRGFVRVVSNGTTELARFTLADGTITTSVQLLGLGEHNVEVMFDAQGAFGASRSNGIALHARGDAGHIGGGSDSCSVNAPGTGSKSGTSGAGAFLTFVALGAVVALRRRRLAVAAAAIACGVLGQRSASAQSAGGFAVDRFRAAAPDSQWFALDSLSFHGHLEASAGVVGDYAHAPLIFYGSDDTTRATVIRHSQMLHAGASLTVYDRFRFAVVAPTSPFQSGDGGMFNGTAVGSPSGGVGDVALAGDARVFGGPDAPFRLALGVKVTTPTGSRSDMLGDGTTGGEPRAAVAGSAGAFVYAAQGSVLLREPVAIAGVRFGSEVRFMASAGLRFGGSRLVVGPELLTTMPLSSSESSLLRQTAAEIDLGAHVQATRALRVGAGAGTGIVSAIGTPDARVLFSVAWTTEVTAPRASPSDAPPPPADVAEQPAPAPVVPVRVAEEAVAMEEPPAEKAAPTYRMLDERVYFAFDSAELQPNELRALESVRATLAAHPNRRARIEGHTDDVGSDEYNAKLSAARALRVIAWLSRHGVHEERLDVIGFGKGQPRGGARATDRRVEFRVEIYE